MTISTPRQEHWCVYCPIDGVVIVSGSRQTHPSLSDTATEGFSSCVRLQCCQYAVLLGWRCCCYSIIAVSCNETILGRCCNRFLHSGCSSDGPCSVRSTVQRPPTDVQQTECDDRMVCPSLAARWCWLLWDVVDRLITFTNSKSLELHISSMVPGGAGGNDWRAYHPVII